MYKYLPYDIYKKINKKNSWCDFKKKFFANKYICQT